MIHVEENFIFHSNWQFLDQLHSYFFVELVFFVEILEKLSDLNLQTFIYRFLVHHRIQDLKKKKHRGIADLSA